MTVEHGSTIDFVVHSPQKDEVLLVMVQDQPWGDASLQLPTLQDKFNTYFNYVVEHQLLRDYPEMSGKPVHIQLRTVEEPGPRELEFLRTVTSQHLEPKGIRCSWKLIGQDKEYGI